MALIKAMNNLCPEMHAVTKMADLTKLQPRRNFVRIVAFAKLVNFLGPFQPSHMYSLIHNFVEISRLTNFAKSVKIVPKMWSNPPFSFLHAFLDISTMNGKRVERVFVETYDGLGLICSSKNWPPKCSNLVLLTKLKT